MIKAKDLKNVIEDKLIDYQLDYDKKDIVYLYKIIKNSNVDINNYFDLHCIFLDYWNFDRPELRPNLYFEDE